MAHNILWYAVNKSLDATTSIVYIKYVVWIEVL